MRIKSISMLIALFLSTAVSADELSEAPLSSNELAHVIAGVISLKTQCINADDDACKQANAVMKMFKKHTLENSSPSGEQKKSHGFAHAKLGRWLY
jgi:hypothetical protein